DRETVVGAGAAGVEEVLATGSADVSHVRHVGERDVADRGGGAHVAVPVVPRAEAAGLVVVGVGAGRRDDVVLGEPVRGRGGVAEVGGSGHGHVADLSRG